MKFNGRLLLLFVMIIAVMVSASVLTFEVTKDSRAMQSAFDNLGEDSFSWVDTIIMQDDMVVYSNVKGEIYNPLELEIAESNQQMQFSWKSANLEGDYTKTADGYLFEGKLRDSKLAIGKENLDVSVVISLDAKQNMIKSITLSYSDRGFDITIQGYRE
ncbi:MAG: hypothetical protein ACI4MI_00090 [Christensenellales bacterium]